MVLKLFAAMKDEKHAGGNAAMANKYMKTAETFGQRCRPSVRRPARHPCPPLDHRLWPRPRSTAPIHRPRSSTPQCQTTRRAARPASRLFIPKSAPAAPAVAKNPTMYVPRSRITPRLEMPADGARLAAALGHEFLAGADHSRLDRTGQCRPSWPRTTPPKWRTE